MKAIRLLRYSICSTVLLVAGVSQLRAEDAAYGWRVGLASAKITPTKPLRMAGYGSKQREQPSQGVATDLYAKAIVLEDQDQHRGLLVTTDIIGLTAAVSQPLYQRIIDETGLRREQILINSSHTHTGPVLGIDEEQLAHLGNPEHIRATVSYTRTLTDQIVELAVQATNRLEPARLCWGMGVATFVMNRREFTERGVRLGVNPRGLVDRGVPIVKVETSDEQTRAVLIGTACHNTTLTGKDMQISGDFAGYAQQYIERQLPGVQAMFLQGCGGDANPFPRGSEEIARVHGLVLGQEVLHVLETELTPVLGPLRTVIDEIALPLRQEFSQQDFDLLERAGGSTRAVARELQAQLKAGQTLPASYGTQVALWQFGTDLTLVALPGEVVVDYVRLIEDAIGPRKLWVTAYNHDVFGYLPSARVLQQGGYEIRGIYAGGRGIFAAECEQVVVDRVRSLAARAGRNEMPTP